MKIDITTRGKIPPRPGKRIVASAARAFLTELGLLGAELSIVLCDDATIHELNRTYRKKNRPTDVLAFALREGEGAQFAGDALGDVVISLETAQRQADEHGHSMTTEVYVLLAHGVLHLLGWDHRTDAEDRRMKREVTRLVATLPSVNDLASTGMTTRAKRTTTRATRTRRR
jgi:probable rRNA maturation factor